MYQPHAASSLPHIKHVRHTPEGLLVEFDQGSTFLNQTSFLWDMRDFEGDAPVDVARGLAPASLTVH